MYARVTEFQIDAARHALATQISQEQIGPAMREMQGFERYLVFGDIESGETIVVTMWATEADEEASRGSMGGRFAALGGIVTSPPRPSKVFQLIDQA